MGIYDLSIHKASSICAPPERFLVSTSGRCLLKSFMYVCNMCVLLAWDYKLIALYVAPAEEEERPIKDRMVLGELKCVNPSKNARSICFALFTFWCVP